MSLVEITEPKTAAEMLARYKTIRRKLTNYVEPVVAMERVRIMPKLPPPPAPVVLVEDVAEAAPEIVNQETPSPDEEIKQPAPPPVVFAGMHEFFSPRAYIHKIIKFVAQKYGVDPEEILAHNRTVNIVRARHIAYAMALNSPKLKKMSIPQIAKVFNRDHTTIMHVISKHPSCYKWRAVNRPKSMIPLVVDRRGNERFEPHGGV